MFLSGGNAVKSCYFVCWTRFS